MFIKALGEDEDIVEVNGDLSFSDEVFENVIHHPLESGGGVG